MYSSSPERPPKLQLTAEQPLKGECWILPKNLPHIQGKSRGKMVGREKSHLESNPIPTRDARRHQTKFCVHQEPEVSQRLSQTCVGVFCRGTGQQSPAAGTGALDAVDPWHKPSRRRSPLTPP